MTPADLDAIEASLREVYLAPGMADAFAKLRRERDAMRKALLFYGKRQHLAGGDWDSCSGEHSMWQFPDQDRADEVMVEGGWIAAEALAGNDLPFLHDDGTLLDDDELAAVAQLREGK